MGESEVEVGEKELEMNKNEKSFGLKKQWHSR